MRKAVFLDRDGVINRKAPEGQYVTRWDEFHLLPGAIEGITQLNRAGFEVIVVTNQRCVAKGLLSEADLQILHRRMTEQLALAGAVIDAIYYCPHGLEPPCECRKPAPGMLLDGARLRKLELLASWMIGDSASDVEAGKSAGCRTAWLSESGLTTERGASPTAADVVARSLPEAVTQILEFDRRTKGSNA